MRRTGSWLAILVLLLHLLHHDAAPARGEEEPPLDPVFRFSRTRITLANEKQLLGSSLRMQGDSLSFYRLVRERSVGYEVRMREGGDFRSFPLTDVARVEVGSGTHGPLGAGIGALIGVGCTLVLYAGDEWEWPEHMFWGTLLFVVPGAAIGGLIGSFIENWETVYTAGGD
jgi:hypothetical protein